MGEVPKFQETNKNFNFTLKMNIVYSRVEKLFSIIFKLNIVSFQKYSKRWTYAIFCSFINFIHFLLSKGFFFFKLKTFFVATVY